MPLVEFPIKAPAPKNLSKSNPSLISQNGVASLVYGTAGNAGNTEDHPSLPDGKDKYRSTNWTGYVTAGQTITVAKIHAIIDAVNNERNRRDRGDIDDELTKTDIDNSTLISHTHFNKVRAGVAGCVAGTSDEAYATDGSDTVTTYTHPAAVVASNNVEQDDKITATGVNAILIDINNAGNQCICNCNYCSCNCNYCTCNCNYSCTCNCNYSDVTTKENIAYM